MARHAGVICDLDEARNLGFLRTGYIHDLTGRDVRFRLDRLPPYQHALGDVVAFELDIDPYGRPWVRGHLAAQTEQGPPVRDRGTTGTAGVDGGRVSGGGGRRSTPPLTVERLVKEEHEGVICEFRQGAGFGFIHNDEVHRLCGRDVRFQSWQYPGHKVGDSVRFRVRLSEDGLPRAAVAGETRSNVGAGNAYAANWASASAAAVGVPEGAAGGLHWAPPPRPATVLRPTPATSWAPPPTAQASSTPTGCGGSMQWHAPTDARSMVTTKPVSGELCEGVVKEVHAAQGFALIACDEVHDASGSGLAMAPRRYLQGLASGDRVAFRLELGGRPGAAVGCRLPRAVDVRILYREA